MFTKEEITQLKTKLEGPEGKAAIETIIASIETMVTAMDTMKLSVENLEMTCEKFKKIAQDNEKAAVDLTQSIKNIHIALNMHRDELPLDLVNLADELGKFVLSGAAIKVGVKANASMD